ncbi:MAG: Spy/CpxP family protein refolding chaperone [Pyrinomonadaceae bacterium]
MTLRNNIGVFILCLLSSAFAIAQARPGSIQDNDLRPMGGPPQDTRANVLRQLGLSPLQMQQIRRLNVDRKPRMDAAQARFREANRALDAVIYGEQVSDVDFQARLRDVQLAHAEVVKIRFTNELAIRNILTTEQLVKFRGLRQRFAQNNAGNQPTMNQRRRMPAPMRRFLRQNPPKKGP